jgi:hypothetical protein
VEKYHRPGHATDDNITRRMRTEWWVTKATDTHSEYVILSCLSTATMTMGTHVNMTSYEQSPSCMLFHTILEATS